MPQTMWSRWENLTASMGRLEERTSMYSQLLRALQRQILLPCLPLTFAYMMLPLRLKPTSRQCEIRISLATRSSLQSTWYTRTAFRKATPITLATGCTPTVSTASPSSAFSKMRSGASVVDRSRRRFWESLALASWESIFTEMQQWKVAGLQMLMLLSEVTTSSVCGLLQVLIFLFSCSTRSSGSLPCRSRLSPLSKLNAQRIASRLQLQKASMSSCGESSTRREGEGCSSSSYSAATSKELLFFLKKRRRLEVASRKPEMVGSMIFTPLRPAIVCTSLPSSRTKAQSLCSRMSSSFTQQCSASADPISHRPLSTTRAPSSFPTASAFPPTTSSSTTSPASRIATENSSRCSTFFTLNSAASPLRNTRPRNILVARLIMTTSRSVSRRTTTQMWREEWWSCMVTGVSGSLLRLSSETQRRWVSSCWQKCSRMSLEWLCSARTRQLGKAAMPKQRLTEAGFSSGMKVGRASGLTTSRRQRQWPARQASLVQSQMAKSGEGVCRHSTTRKLSDIIRLLQLLYNCTQSYTRRPDSAMSKACLGRLIIQMKTALIKSQKMGDQLNRFKGKIQKDIEALPIAHKDPRFPLPSRSPQKTGKVDIRQLFKDDKVDGIPVFPFAAPLQSHREWAADGRATCVSSPKRVEFNIRNLISQSTHHVPTSAKQEFSSPRKTGRSFRVSQPKANSRELHVSSLEEMRHSFLNVSEQLGLIANLKDSYRGETAKASAQPARERMKIYMGSLVKRRWEKDVLREERERVEKIRIIPWEKSFETEEDNFLQN